MPLELNTPACLPLGLVRAHNATHALGFTLRHPPVNLTVLPASTLEVSGPCFHLARVAAERMLTAHHAVPAELEIELAIPLLMGLGGEPLLALSTGRALAQVNQTEADAPTLHHWLGLDALAALETAAFAGGGFLQVNVDASVASGAVRRASLTHEDDRAWAVVLFLPKPAPHHPDTLEADRRAALLRAAVHLDPTTNTLVAEHLWPALERDDFDSFTRAVAELHLHNLAALEAAGTPLAPTPEAQTALNVFRAENLTAYGQCLTGLGVYAMVRGAEASQVLRAKLMARLGYEAGTIMAAITDNNGCLVRNLNRDLPPGYSA